MRNYFFGIGLCFTYLATLMCAKDVEEYPNILGGTQSRYDLSHGSTLPLITLPWGFNSWAPQTNDGMSVRMFFLLQT